MQNEKNVLNLSEDDEKIFSLSRIYYADDEPVNYTRTYLPYKYFPDIELFDFSRVSLYKILEEKYNVKITKSNSNNRSY